MANKTLKTLGIIGAAVGIVAAVTCIVKVNRMRNEMKELFSMNGEHECCNESGEVDKTESVTSDAVEVGENCCKCEDVVETKTGESEEE